MEADHHLDIYFFATENGDKLKSCISLGQAYWNNSLQRCVSDCKGQRTALTLATV